MLKSKFKTSPTRYYAMSIAATWANAGSLLNGISIARNDGMIPYILWALGNTLACILFGLLAPRIPRLRDVAGSRIMKLVMGIMCPFQCWISMNGIETVFAETEFGSETGINIAIAFAALFILMLFSYGMIRNILTDHISWTIVYAVVFTLAAVTLITARGNTNILHLGAENISSGIKNCLLLIPGAFLYPYYYEILNYNDSNVDGTRSVNVRQAFVRGGLVFGLYLVGIALLSLVNFGPVLSFVKAVLVTLIAISSLSSFQYSLYIIFGRNLGLVLNILTLFLWRKLIPLGVMGAWTLMASIRIYIVAGALAAAFVWHIIDRRREVKVV